MITARTAAMSELVVEGADMDKTAQKVLPCQQNDVSDVASSPVVKTFCENLKKRGIQFEVIPMKPKPRAKVVKT